MNARVRERIFLVGCPRSGTTLLQSVLSANSHIISFPESHFFEQLFSGRTLLFRLGIVSHNARKRWNEYLCEIERKELQSILPRHAIFTHQFSGALVQVFDTLTLEQGGSIWVEKTPGHLHYVESIENLIYGAKFVHILREGVDVVASLFDTANTYPEGWGPGYRTIDQCIERWLMDIRFSKACLSRENHALVRYEDLIADPSSVVIDLCKFIDVPFEGQMLEDYRNAAEELILKNETWKSKTFQPIQAKGKSKFYEVFNRSQRDYILERIPNGPLEELN